MPKQQSVDVNDITCHECLGAVCKRCGKHLVAEYAETCTCSSIPRTLSVNVIFDSVAPLLQLSHLKYIMQQCALVSLTDIFSPPKSHQFVLPDYSVLTESIVKQCLIGEVMALENMKLARSDDLVYSNVPESYNRALFDLENVDVCGYVGYLTIHIA